MLKYFLDLALVIFLSPQLRQLLHAGTHSPLGASGIFVGHASSSRRFYVRVWDSRVVDERHSFCGGTLVSSRWVLTAATCVVHGADYFVEHNAFEEEERLGHYYDIQQYFFHPNFDRSTLSQSSQQNNIALLKLRHRVPPYSIIQLCHERETPCHFLGVCGMGSLGHQADAYTPVLQELLLRESVGRFQLFQSIPQRYIPTRREESAHLIYTLCNGDIGGPLYTFVFGTRTPRCLYGVAIRLGSLNEANETHCEQYPSFASVPFFRYWIRSTMRNNGGE